MRRANSPGKDAAGSVLPVHVWVPVVVVGVSLLVPATLLYVALTGHLAAAPARSERGFRIVGKLKNAILSDIRRVVS